MAKRKIHARNFTLPIHLAICVSRLTQQKTVVVVTVVVEIKCQLDATDEFLLQILFLAQHISGTIMPIIRTSRVLYKWLLPVVFGVWFSSCRCSVELSVVCPVCGLLLYSRAPDDGHNGARNMLR